jgi:nitrous oxidase accessory protein NosD
VRIIANYVRVEGIAVDGDGVGTAVNVLDGSAVHLDGLTVGGADTGIHSQFNASLAVRDCAIEATDTGVRLTDASQNTLMQNNDITGAERGVFADSRNTPLDISAVVEGNAFENVGTDVSAEGLVDIPGYDVGADRPGDSSLDLLLYALTAGSLGLLFIPYALRRRG